MDKKKYIHGKERPLIDIPALVISGASIGFLIDGVLFSTLGAVLESGTGSVWNWPTLGAGLVNVSISAILAAFGWVYWKAIVKNKGQLFPRLLGFGLIPALLALLSAAFVGTELYIWIAG